MADTSKSRAQPSGMNVVWAVVIIGVLFFAREVLLPFALAVLFTFVSVPVVRRLEKWRLPRIAAVLLVVTTSFLAFGGFGYLLFAEVCDVAERLPEYEDNLSRKAKSLRSGQSGPLANILKTFEHVQRDLEGKPVVRPRLAAPGKQTDPVEEVAPGSTDPEAAELSEPTRPVPVQVVDSLSPTSVLPVLVTELLHPLGTAAVVVIFVIFMLLEREDLRNRLIRLVGSQQLNFTTQALDDAAKRVGRYLRMQVLINTFFGGVATLGLFLLGVPNALLWGICAFLLRFVPYIGPVAAAVIPTALALAVFDGWVPAGLVVVLFVVDETIAGNVLEPKLYGASTNISGFGVMAASVFWMWLWGPVGLILAMPLTVCLVVIGSYVPKLSFLNTLLADRSVLPPGSRYYQRLLASDPDEAQDVAEEFLKTHDLASLYDTVFIPALSLAENDRHRGGLSDSAQELIYNTTRELVDEFAARAAAESPASTEQDSHTAGQDASKPPGSVICLPSRDEADEIVALMLSQLLRMRGVPTQVMSVTSLASEMVSAVTAEQPAVVCVSALPPFAGTHARYLCKRIGPALGAAQMVVGLWLAVGVKKKAEERLSQLGVTRCITSVTEAADYIAQVSNTVKTLVRSA